MILRVFAIYSAVDRIAFVNFYSPTFDWEDIVQIAAPAMLAALCGIGLYVLSPVISRLIIPEKLALLSFDPQLQDRMESYGIALLGVYCLQVGSQLWFDYVPQNVMAMICNAVMGLIFLFAARPVHRLISRERKHHLNLHPSL